MKPIKISYFSDVLCVWAYVAQIRIDELLKSFPNQIEIDFHFFQIFGFAKEKLDTRWKNKGGLRAFDQHLQEVASEFEHIEVNPKLWTAIAPKSSMPAHLFLCAIRHLEDSKQIEFGSLYKAMWAVRCAFFRDARDISSQRELETIASSLNLSMPIIQKVINSGQAHAELSKDLFQAQQQAITVSPTMTFNEGRQKLTGNVGYRVIEANIKELLLHPDSQNSWC